jgi:SAM-dependent MidA family methyltransferase
MGILKGAVMERDQKAGTLRNTIIENIRAGGGRIPFSSYMELCLYEPTGGYYQRAKPKLGKAGDFYTSAHIGAAMGQCIAVKLHESANELEPDGGPVTIVEWGGGDGRLAESVLEEIYRSFPETYRRCVFLGVESSPYHRTLQRNRLERFSNKIADIAAPEDCKIAQVLKDSTTLLFANELLDAFPVHRLRFINGVWKELYVEWDEEQETFREQAGPIADASIAAIVGRHRLGGEQGQTIEVGKAALDWIRWLGGAMRKGFVLLADYGDVSAELYAPYRMSGTLLTYQNHTAADDVYRAPGEQDITAHVNFEWCLEAAADAGFTRGRLLAQKQFLVEQGILNRLLDHNGQDPFSPEARSNRAIRQLLLSDGMSELFKVVTFQKRP